MANTGNGNGSVNPFHKAADSPYYPFFEVRGEPGSGKTNLALMFPDPCVVSSDGSAIRYCKEKGIDVVTSVAFDQVNDEILPFLASGKHKYRTLVLDTATVLWDQLQRKWQDYGLKKQQNKVKSASATAPIPTEYELTMRDRGFIRADWAELMRRMVALRMIKVVTVHLKPEYVGEQQTGFTADAHATLSRYPNVIIELKTRPGQDGKLVYGGRVIKEHKIIGAAGLPEIPFTNVYAEVEKVYGKYLNQKAAAVDLGEQRVEVVHHVPGQVPTVIPVQPAAKPAPVAKTVTTAPPPPPAAKPAEAKPEPNPAAIATAAKQAAAKATPEQCKKLNDLVHDLDLGPDELAKRLASYGAHDFTDLTSKLADVIIKRLSDRVAALNKEGR